MRLPRRRRPTSGAVAHPPVGRRLYVRAEAPAVRAHRVRHGAGFGSGVPRRRVVVGSCVGWTALGLPPAVHPWHPHDLVPSLRTLAAAPDDVVALSDAGPGQPGYWLVPDPRPPIPGTPTSSTG